MPANRDHGSALPPLEAIGTNDVLEARAQERNRILRAMPPEEYSRIRPELQSYTVEALQELAPAGGTLDFVYFPESTIVSIARRMRDGSLIEAGTIGCEGMAGLGVLFGESWSPGILQGQVPGVSKRVRFAAMRELLPELHVLRAILGRFALSFLDQLGQTAACNALHTIEQRCARWLLMTHDRVGGDEFKLTHVILSQMLGVRRASVSEVAGVFQDAGVIHYEQGRVSILQRAGLEVAACECYGIVRSNMHRLLSSGAP